MDTLHHWYKKLGLLLALLILPAMLFLGGEALAQSTLGTVAPNVPQGPGLIVESDRAGINVPIAGDLRLDQAIKNIINFILGFLALIAVIVIIVAGIRLVASAGNEDARNFAKQALTWSIIGLLLVALSWSIVAFVIDALSAGSGGAGRGGAGRGASSMEVRVMGDAAANRNAIIGVHNAIEVQFVEGGNVAGVLIHPQFANEELGDITRYEWEVFRFETRSAEVIVDEAPAMPTGLQNLQVLRYDNGQLRFENFETRETFKEGTCSPNCSVGGSPKLYVEYPRTYDLGLRLTTFNRDGERLGMNEFQLRTAGTTAPATSAQDPRRATVIPPQVLVNGVAARVDLRDEGDREAVTLPPSLGGQNMVLVLRYPADNRPSTVDITGQNVSGTALNTISILGRPVSSAEVLIPLDNTIPTTNSVTRLQITSNYSGSTSTKTVYIQVGTQSLDEALRSSAPGEFYDIAFTINGATYLPGAVYTMTAPQDVVLDAKLTTNSSLEFTQGRVVLDGYRVLSQGPISNLNIKQEISAATLQAGKVHTIQAIFATTDGSVQRNATIRLAVAASQSAIAQSATAPTAPHLDPILNYAFTVTGDTEADRSVQLRLRDFNTPIVVPAFGAQGGIVFSVKDGERFRVWGRTEPQELTVTNCRWDFGQDRVLTDNACGNVAFSSATEERIPVVFTYMIGGVTQEYRFVLDIRSWGPHFTVEPRAAQLGEAVTFTPQADLRDDRDLAIIRSILNLPASSPLTRLQIRWKFFDTLEQAEDMANNGKLVLQGDTLRHSFLATEGFEPGKDYYVRMEAEYTYRDSENANQRRVFSNVQQFSMLNRPPVAQLQVRQPDSERNNFFVLDGSGSYDPDGELVAYRWSYRQTMGGEGQALGQPYQAITAPVNQSRIEWTVNQAGTYQVRLQIEDRTGLQAIREQTINVPFVLSMDFFAGTSLATMSTDKLVVVSRPGNADARVTFGLNNITQGIQFLEWNFGDGTTERTLVGVRERVHTYTAAGSYQVRVTGTDATGNRVTRSKEIYVAEADSPRAAINVSFPAGPRFPVAAGQSTCTNVEGERQNVYQITRGTQVRFDGSKSVNRAGDSTGLEYRWNVAGALERYTPSFTQQFSNIPREGSCLPVELTVVDTSNDRTHTSEPVYFQIINSPPTIGALRVMTNGTRTPVQARVFAENVRDEDGTVAKYTWYYYEAGANPQSPGVRQGVQETTNPTALFIIPSSGIAESTSQYVFAVDVTDNEGNTTNSYRVLGEEATTITVTNSAPATLSLQMLATPDQVRVGSSVTFRATARYEGEAGAVSGAFYSYDVDGDGTYDFLNQGPTFTYRYTGQEQIFANIADTATVPITVRAQVFHRNQVAEATAPIRVVKEVVRPEADFDYRMVNGRVYFVNASKGTGLRYEWDLDAGPQASCADLATMNREANIASPSKVYAGTEERSAKVILVVTNTEGQQSCREKTIRIVPNATPPTVQLQADIFGSTVRFRNPLDPTRALSYAWYYNAPGQNHCANPGNLLSSTLPDSVAVAPTHTYSETGTYKAVLIASDQSGATTCVSKDIIITSIGGGSSGGGQGFQGRTDSYGNVIDLLRGAPSSSLQLQVGRTTVFTGEPIQLRATLLDRTGTPIAEPVYSFDIDANVRPGDDLTNVNRVGEAVYTYEEYQEAFTPAADGTLSAEFMIVAKATYQDTVFESEATMIQVIHDPLRAAREGVTVSLSSQEIHIGQPLTMTVSVPESLATDITGVAFDMNNNGVFDVQGRELAGSYRYTGSEFATEQTISPTQVRAKLFMGHREVITEGVPLRVLRHSATERQVYEVRLVPSATRVALGSPITFQAIAYSSDGRMVVDRSFAYDFNGDGTYEQSQQGQQLDYTYTTEAWQQALQAQGPIRTAVVNPRVRLSLNGKEVESAPVAITLVAPTTNTLTPEVAYISPNPGPYVENALLSTDIVVPLEAAASDAGVRFQFAERSNTQVLSRFNREVTWSIGGQQARGTIDAPVTIRLGRPGSYPVQVRYTTREGQAMTYSFTVHVQPWFGEASVTPSRPKTNDHMRLAVSHSIVEHDWATLRSHRKVLPETPIVVKEQGWRIIKGNDTTPVYSSSDRMVEGVVRDVIPAEHLTAGATYTATYRYVLRVEGESEDLVYETSTQFTVDSTPPVPALFWYQRDANYPERFWLDGRQSFDTVPNADLEYSWTVLQDDTPVETVSNRDGVWIWTAPDIGIYDVRMTVRNNQGGEAQVTKPLFVQTIEGGAGYGTADDLLQSAKASFQYMSLVGNRVVFRLDDHSTVLSAVWDLDTSVDANGSGAMDDDMEAEGPIFEATFNEVGTYPVQVTVTENDGLTYQKTQLVEVQGGSRSALRNQPLAAVLQVLPRKDDNGLALVRTSYPTVVFIPSDSTGDIVEYAIDVDVEFDSDGDGVTDNDVDNRNHPSLTSGDPFTYTYDPTIGNVTARLTVKDSSGATASTTMPISFVATTAAGGTQYGSASFINTIQTITPEERQERIDAFLAALEEVNISNLRKNYFRERLEQLATADLSPYDREVIRQALEREIDEMLITNREKAVLKALLQDIPLVDERVVPIEVALLSLEDIIEQIQERIAPLPPRTRLSINQELLKIFETMGSDPAVVEMSVGVIRDLLADVDLPANIKTEIEGFLQLLAEERIETQEPVEEPGEETPVVTDPEEPNSEQPVEEPQATERSGWTFWGVVLGILQFALIIFLLLMGLGALLYWSYLRYKKKSGKEDLEFEEYVLHLRSYMKSTPKEETTHEEVITATVDEEAPLPSWLDMGEETAPTDMGVAQESTPSWMKEEAVVEEQIPSWMKEEKSATEKETTPPWMADTPPTTPQPTVNNKEEEIESGMPSSTGIEAGAMPSWLQMDEAPLGNTTQAEEKPTPIEPATQETEAPTTPTESTEANTGEIQIPDWLRDDSPLPVVSEETEPEATQQPEVQEQPTPEVQEQPEVPTAPLTPDWQAYDKAHMEEEVAAAEAIKEAEVPTPIVEQPAAEASKKGEAPTSTEELPPKPKRKKYTTPAEVFEGEEPVLYSDFIGFDDPAEIAKREEGTPQSSQTQAPKSNKKKKTPRP